MGTAEGASAGTQGARPNPLPDCRPVCDSWTIAGVRLRLDEEEEEGSGEGTE